MEAEPIEASAFLGEDGALQEGWQGIAFPDDDDPHKTNPTLANIKDIQSLARQTVSGESTIGKLSGGRAFAILPNENSTPEEIVEYHTKTGRPENAEGYGLGKDWPEGTKVDEKFVAKMSQAMFDAGASGNIGAAVKKAYGEYTTELAATMATEDKITNTKADQQLRSLLGSAYDDKMKLGNLAIQALALPIDPAFAETLTKEMPYDQNVAQMMIKIGEMISEDPGLKEKAAGQTFTPGDAMAKINEIMADPYYRTDSPKDMPENTKLHLELVQKVNDLFKMRQS